MEVEIEVFFAGIERAAGSRSGSWDHQEGEGLGSRRSEGGLVAILEMECSYVVDAEEQARIIATSRHGCQQGRRQGGSEYRTNSRNACGGRSRKIKYGVKG
jgi:hypothetical protein